MQPGTKVKIINENGNKCAVGLYLGEGIPPRDLNAQYPNLKHFAIQVEGEVRYYPTGFHTLLPEN
jgi:hypothetical protein